MGRSPLPLNTAGKTLFVPQPSGRVLARAWYRDSDGKNRLVARVGDSRAAAERALKTTLATRSGPGGAGALTADTRVSDLAGDSFPNFAMFKGGPDYKTPQPSREMMNGTENTAGGRKLNNFYGACRVPNIDASCKPGTRSRRPSRPASSSSRRSAPARPRLSSATSRRHLCL